MLLKIHSISLIIALFQLIFKINIVLLSLLHKKFNFFLNKFKGTSYRKCYRVRFAYPYTFELSHS